ncbi:MAG: hypothetical protein LBP72_01635, partial [Dysgonamonadaceae bacterium]|nr:hypothetical protein [Dysgonamonadaceae bacterium]
MSTILRCGAGTCTAAVQDVCTIPVIPRLTRDSLKDALHCRIAIRRQAYPVNNPRIYPGINVASYPMNAGGVTLLCMCKTPKGQRHPAFAGG